MIDYIFISNQINYSIRVWSDWTIANNNFVAMNMIEGSRCGEGTHRSTKVSNKLNEVSYIFSYSFKMMFLSS